MKEKDRLITVKEVCQILKISRRTLYRLISQGRLPGFKVGHEWRFRYGEVDKYLEGKITLRPRYFYTTVLEKYRQSPDKYEITDDKKSTPQGQPVGGWLSLTEAYQAVYPGRESFPKLRFTYHTGKAGIKFIRVMPHSFNALPLAEIPHWLPFEMS